jgi:DNA polymerase IV
MMYRPKQKYILHIDYDSFFASVEQQANPFLRNKPIAITGDSAERGIACTASRDAKKLGVKTGMPIFKARQICPNLIVVKGDFVKYAYVHKESLKIFNKYTDLVEPFSIDEAFLDMTQTMKYFKSPQHVSECIKRDISKKFGEYITCSIGIGPNKLLAKLVSDINKPNGLFIITQQNIEQVLRDSELTDFCGIGPRLKQRLNQLGIFTIKELQNASDRLLREEFGTVTGSFLKDLSYGKDDGHVSPSDFYQAPKSISHQHTLHKNTSDIQIIKANLQHLCYMVAKRLRNHNMLGNRIYFCLGDKGHGFHTQKIKLYRHTDSSKEMFEEIDKALVKLNWKKECRFVAMGILDLIKKDRAPIYLFETLENPTSRNKKANGFLDDINNKWGEHTIVTAATLLADNTKKGHKTPKMSSFLKHR